MIYRSLTDYFTYGNILSQDLEDLVHCDIFNEHETDYEYIKTLAEYLDRKNHELKGMDDKLFTEEKFTWQVKEKAVA